MQSFITKIKIIYVPFLLIAIGVIAIYSLFNYVFVIKTGILPIYEAITNIMIPIFLPWLPLYFWLFPRIKLLNFLVKARTPGAFFMMIAGYAIIVTTVVVQPYIITATGKLTNLDSINDLDKFPPTKYYRLKSHKIDLQHSLTYTVTGNSGKRNQTRYMDLYFVFPVEREVNSVVTGKPDTSLYIGATELPKA